MGIRPAFKKITMLGLYITKPWPSFYRKGMKTWEIRSYPTTYRGDIILIESKTNIAVSSMTLVDCIPLTKQLWEMNYEKHRTACSYELLPYRKNDSPGYAWVLKNKCVFTDEYSIIRVSSKPTINIDDDFIEGKAFLPLTFNPERIACKFLGDNMLLYWLKKTYFALIAIVNISTGTTNLVLDEIGKEDADYILNQINVL